MLATFWMKKIFYVMVANLNRFISFIQSLQVIWKVFVSSHVTSHKFLEDVHEDSMLFPSQINRILCNRPDEPLKTSRRLVVSRNFSVKDVQTLGQHRPDARSSFSNFYSELDFNRHLFRKFLQDVRTTWQLVRTQSSIPKYFRFPLQARKGVTAKTVRSLSQAI
jgi:hypothetical protein